MATILKPDSTKTINGVNVNEFLLTKHNPNKIKMPDASMAGKVIGVTIHNTDDLVNVEDDAEQYTRATYNGNMNDVRVHYYVDDICAWQNLPLDLAGWHATDGPGNGNRRTIAIECIMHDKDKKHDEKAEDNCARLAAYLLHKYNLDIDHLYTHTHWLNVKNGKSGTVDTLNTMHNSYKMCPAYILPHWQSFKNKVAKYLDELNGKKTTSSKPKEEKYPFTPNAKMLASSKTYADNGRKVKVGGVDKSEKIKLLAAGPTNAIIQYKTSDTAYKVGIVYAKDVKKD